VHAINSITPRQKLKPMHRQKTDHLGDPYQRTLFKWTLLIPAGDLAAYFHALPAVYCLYYSFHQWGMQGNALFVGLDNYRHMLRDEAFLIAFGRTLEVLAICIIVELLAGLGLASMWNREFRARMCCEDLPSASAGGSSGLVIAVELHVGI